MGTATLDFCDSRGLSQLVHFPTRDTAILNLVLSEHDCEIKSLPNFNTSDHVALMITIPLFSASSDDITPPPSRSIHHWKRASWSRMSHFFKNANWNFSGSVDAAVSNVTEIITAAINKYVPSCTPRLCRPTPWWDRHCERIWMRKFRY